MRNIKMPIKDEAKEAAFKATAGLQELLTLAGHAIEIEREEVTCGVSMEYEDKSGFEGAAEDYIKTKLAIRTLQTIARGEISKVHYSDLVSIANYGHHYCLGQIDDVEFPHPIFGPIHNFIKHHEQDIIKAALNNVPEPVGDQDSNRKFKIQQEVKSKIHDCKNRMGKEAVRV